MTVDDVKKVAEEIKENMWDVEAAHSREDGLHMEFIEEIASSGLGELTLIANEILKIRDIDFPRYCA